MRARVAALAALLVACALLAAGCGGSERRLRVLPLGDSLTFGGTVDGRVPGGYRAPLASELRRARVPARFVGTSLANPLPGQEGEADASSHDGWPGARVDELDASLGQTTALDGGHWLDGTATRRALRPDVVVVHAGTNDIGQGYDPQGTYPGGRYDPADPAQRAAFVAHLAGRLTALVEHVHGLAPDAGVVLCTVGPLADPTAADLDAAIRAQVVPALQAAGVRVALADTAAALGSVGPGQMSADGVHPTAQGYGTMAAVIAPQVAALAGER